MADFHSDCIILPPLFSSARNFGKGGTNADTFVDTIDVDNHLRKEDCLYRENNKENEERQQKRVVDNVHNNRNTIEEEFSSISSTVEERLSHHRLRRNKWLNEALGDYRAADHLHPP